MTTDSKTQLLQASPLLRRLDKRLTHPVGLIDVRQSQKAMPQLPSAVIQRFSFLEGLQRRYGVKTDRAVSGSEMMVASSSGNRAHLQPKPVEAGEGAAIENLFSKSSEITATQAGIPAPLIHRMKAPGATFRIRRKVMPFEPGSGAMANTPGQETSGEHSGPLSNDAPSPPRATSMQPEPTKSDEGWIAKSGAEALGDSRVIRKPMESQLLSSSVPSLRSVRAQAIVMRSPTTENVDEERKQQDILRTKPLPFAHRSSVPFISLQAKEMATTTEIQPAVSPVSHSPLIWRQHEQPDRLATDSRPDGMASTVSSPGISQQRSQAQIITRQPAPRSMSSSNPRAISSAHLGAQPEAIQSHGISLEDVAEEVSRILCRDLTIQRERRGMRP